MFRNLGAVLGRMPSIEYRDTDRKLHNTEGPAEILLCDDGTILIETWYSHGLAMSDVQRRAPEFGVGRDNAAALDVLDGIPLSELLAGHPSVALALALYPNP